MVMLPSSNHHICRPSVARLDRYGCLSICLSVLLVQVFEYLLCSQAEADSFRFRSIIDKLIDDGELERYGAYSKWAKKVKKPANSKGECEACAR